MVSTNAHHSRRYIETVQVREGTWQAEHSYRFGPPEKIEIIINPDHMAEMPELERVIAAGAGYTALTAEMNT